MTVPDQSIMNLNHNFYYRSKCNDPLNNNKHCKRNTVICKNNKFVPPQSSQSYQINNQIKIVPQTPTITSVPNNAGFSQHLTTIPLPLSSSSSSGSSVTSRDPTRSSSLPRMGVKGKTAAKFPRNTPCPPPIPPPKCFPNPLAPLHSTEILDQSDFWVREH